MYLPKPIYESLPYFYLLAGIMFVAGAAYISHWFTGAPVYSYFGYFCVIAGLAISLRRFAYRRNAKKSSEDGAPEVEA